MAGTSKQLEPQVGDRYQLCIHLAESDSEQVRNWWWWSPEIFTKPQGVWAVLCDGCHEQAGASKGVEVSRVLHVINFPVYLEGG